MSNERSFTGWFIPVELIQDYDLSASEAMLWAEVYALSRRPEKCTASNEHFMAQFKKSESAIQAMLLKLRLKGLISNVGFDGRVRRMMAMAPWMHPQVPDRDRGGLGFGKQEPTCPENATPDTLKTGCLDAPPYIEKRTDEEKRMNTRASAPCSQPVAHKPERPTQQPTSSRPDDAQSLISELNTLVGRTYTATKDRTATIKARLQEVDGDVAGVRVMLARQVALWGSDEKMAQYLTPDTLFRKSKFIRYYEERNLPVETGKCRNPEPHHIRENIKPKVFTP